MRKKLPLGIQNFRDMREDGYYYVDKTAYIHRLVDSGKYYFLSRPRRFGKSLFVDTMKELFEGNEKLFQGLFICDKWDWTKKYPVIKISFGGGNLSNCDDLNDVIHRILNEHEAFYSFKPRYQDNRSRFHDLIGNCCKQFRCGVVILVDEYDKPILDIIENSQTALLMRETLKDFYSVIKDNDDKIRFAFLTGVSKFSKVSLFSGLNNLIDVTLDDRYSSICGYTQTDIETIFSDQIIGLDKEQIREWYNGYNWLGESVYNPYDLLLLFDKRKFSPFWFETGTPTFLIKILKERKAWLPGLNQSFSTERLLSTFDVDTMPTESLMFQSGYLTVKSFKEIPGRIEIELGYPNKEVMSALNETLLWEYVGTDSSDIRNVSRAHTALVDQDLSSLERILHALYAGIPYQWYVKNKIAEYEGYYASVFYAFFASLGLDIICEESSNAGRLDMAIKLAECVYLFEFKILEHSEDHTALAQIKDKGYADKYCAEARQIYLIGIEFSKEKRQIEHFQWEKR